MPRLLFLSFVLILFGSIDAQAQQREWHVISSLQAADDVDTAPQVAVTAGELERFVVEFNEDLLQQEALRTDDELVVSLPTDERRYRVVRVSEHVPGTVSVSALASDGSHDVFAVTFTSAGAVGMISSDHDLFHVAGDADGIVLMRMDPHEVDEIVCGVDHDHEAARGEGVGAGRAAFDSAVSSLNMRGLSETVHDPITIDLMIVYTQNAQAWSANQGGIDAVIAQAMNLSQLALDNSEVFIEMRLVHSALTNYNENTPPPAGQGASSAHLRRLTASPSYNPWGPQYDGYMTEVHDLREEYGADLVALFAQISDVGGIAWLLNSIGGRPEIGFSVNRVQQMATSYTLIHEIGHNMGSRHARNQPSGASPPAGGLFEYAVGLRFAGNSGNWATVMAYETGGYSRVPYFSNPDLTHDGAPTGTMTGVAGPANNGRAFREVKRVVASYQPTMVNPPAGSITPSEVEVEMPIESIVSRSVEVANSGSSALVWDMDFVNTTIAARGDDHASFSGAVVELVAEVVAPVGGPSPTDVASTDGETVIYETTFSAEEGFNPGTHHSVGGWSGTEVAGRVRITDENPSSGSQHLRFPANAPFTTVSNMYSTYFGPWPAGAYSMSFDFSVTEESQSTYFIMLQDSRLGDVVAGLRLSSNGQIAAYDIGGIPIPGEVWVPGEYRNITIEIDPMTGSIDYFLDGEHVITRPAPYGPGVSFGRFWVQRSAGGGADQLDLDNVHYSSEYRGLGWLRAERMGGVVPADESATYDIDFVSEDLEPGVYTAEIRFTTNDPEQLSFSVPVSLNTKPISGEQSPGEAASTRLVGHFPNPVSTTARIQFELGEAEEVNLEVFSVTGRRVLVAAEGMHTAGPHEVELDVSHLANGVYFYRLSTPGHAETGRLTVLR